MPPTTLLMKLNVMGQRRAPRLGKPYWSLSKAAKHKVKNAVEFISQVRGGGRPRRRRARGGRGGLRPHPHRRIPHLHHDGRSIEYWNDGDWVEGCNALVEHHDGRMEILHWPAEVAQRKAAAAAEVAEAGSTAPVLPPARAA
jgi:UDP-2,3-diacylglucosamine pyrophosphatase LpxH